MVSSIKTKRHKLLNEALILRKAWSFTILWIGFKQTKSKYEDVFLVPNFEAYPKKKLEKLVAELRLDFSDYINIIADVKAKKDIYKAAKWMALQYDRVMKTDLKPITICTAHFFEQNFGKLKERRNIEVPPYAELLLQGIHGLAIRHPEYMLGRDLALMYGLFLDAEDLISGIDWKKESKWAGGASENGQALARGTMISCFNLLEAFVSGLARAYLIENPKCDERVAKKLTDHMKPLKNRLVSIPNIVSGESCGLDVNKPPISILFGEIKERRDAFVHCDPGPQKSPRGYIKEERFHDVSKEVVETTVDLTFDIIKHIWKFLHGNERPRWLPERNSKGRFSEKVDLRLSHTFPLESEQ